MKLGVLYISYDGMLEPLGQSQVLAYLKPLAQGRRIHLISFEKKDDWTISTDLERLKAEINSARIIWHPLRYHKRPSAAATAWDILCGIRLGLWLVLRHRLHVVHARSYVASVMALSIKLLTGVKYIFDMRGFWADERVDGGLWIPGGKLYRVAKFFEKHFFLNSDHVVSLTQAAVKEIQGFDYLKDSSPPVSVITTCVDLNRFKSLPHNYAKRRFVLGYVGSAGTWYLFDEVVKCFTQLLLINPDAYFLIVNRGQHDYISDILLSAGISADKFELTSSSHNEMPKLIARMHAGIFFYKTSFSRTACAPTRLGEFLACGKPCLSNAGVGDMAEVLEGYDVGIAMNSFDDATIKVALKRLIALSANLAVQSRCVEAAAKHFSLVNGVNTYGAIYDQFKIELMEKRI